MLDLRSIYHTSDGSSMPPSNQSSAQFASRLEGNIRATLATCDRGRNEETEEIDSFQYSIYPFSARLLDVSGAVTVQDHNDR